MDIVDKLRIIAETTADDFPLATIEKWMGEGADEIDALRALCRALLTGADKLTHAPHFIVQPFMRIVLDHRATIQRHRLFEPTQVTTSVPAAALDEDKEVVA